ncbi:MAG: Ribosomal protein [Chloroflexota bacterium]|jgi:large subunit ribosomal protein L29|nr:Ribosomal protein [Chloroflexota bacterium]
MDIDNVRNLTDTELLGELVTQRRALYDLRFQLATRQLTDHSQLTQTRRSIARVLTVMTERSLDETMVPRTAAPKPVTRAAAAKPAAKSAAKKDGDAKSAPAKKAATKSTTRAKTAAAAAKGDEE